MIHHRPLQPIAEHLEVYHAVEFLQRIAYLGEFLCRILGIEEGLLACGLIFAQGVTDFYIEIT